MGDKVTAGRILELIERQNYRCAISGRELTPETASLDHKIPLSKGGDHSLANIWIVHVHVNSAKGTMTIEEFVAMCKDVTANNC